MPFIDIRNNEIHIDDSDWEENNLIKIFASIIKRRCFDEKYISSGVNPSPDFGYYELANRFWRASLCIYFTGVTGGFWERGAGYTEPWLFNLYHSIELYVKGFLSYANWFQELQNNPFNGGKRVLINKVKNRHQIDTIYLESLVSG